MSISENQTLAEIIDDFGDSTAYFDSFDLEIDTTDFAPTLIALTADDAAGTVDVTVEITITTTDDLGIPARLLDTDYADDMFPRGAWLTTNGVALHGQVLDDMLRQRAGDSITGATIMSTDPGNDAPEITASATRSFPADATFAKVWDEFAWTIIAEVNNLHDPGTFNCPYLWSEFIERADA